jgi:AcrR family transcriptional regulator
MRGSREEDGTGVPTTRKDKALATRRRILRAAYELLCEAGYLATTMAAIAERAGVAEQTIYFTFTNKPAIVTEVLHASVVGLERWTPTLDREVHQDHLTVLREFPWFEAFEAEPDPRRAIERYVEAAEEILDRIGPLLAALGGLRIPELEAALARSEQLRVEAATFVLRALATKGAGLRKGLKPARARDIFLVLTGAQLHHQLTVGRGWSRRQTKQWLTELLCAQLLAVDSPSSNVRNTDTLRPRTPSMP